MYMMKKILLLAGIVSLAACTNDPLFALDLLLQLRCLQKILQ